MMEKFVTKVRPNAKSNVNRTRKTLTEIEHLQSSRLVITLLLVLPNFKLFQLEKKEPKGSKINPFWAKYISQNDFNKTNLVQKSVQYHQ